MINFISVYVAHSISNNGNFNFKSPIYRQAGKEFRQSFGGCQKVRNIPLNFTLVKRRNLVYENAIGNVLQCGN